MNIVICAATYNSYDRAKGWLEAVYRCYLQDCEVVLINTGDSFTADQNATLVDIPRFSKAPAFVQAVPMKRFYSSVMKHKVDYFERYPDDMIFINSDDDYAFNPYAFSFANAIFSRYPQVNYLSFVKGPGVIKEDNELVELCGQRFYVAESAMGGSIMTRWSAFHPAVSEFFYEYGVTLDNPGLAHHFDIPYWEFLKKRDGNVEIFTLYDFSLMAHCNLMSNYLDEKGDRGKLNHMRGEQFDPRLNPFTF